MFEAVAGELRAKLVGTEKHIRNSGFPQRRLLTALRRRKVAPQAPPQKPTAQTLQHRPRGHHTNTQCSLRTAPPSHSGFRYAEGPTWRSTPRRIPSTQCKFSQKAPQKSLVGMSRTLMVRAVFPCDDIQCKQRTLRQQQDNLKKPWEFWRLPPLTDVRPAHPTCSRVCGPGRSVSGAA